MKKVSISGTDLEVSKFIYGTADLFNLRGANARRRLLSNVVDAGFTHFDTAPYYGFGLAERELAPILRANSQITVTTKVGIYAQGGEQQSPASVFMRKALGRVIKPLSKPSIDFSIERAKDSLESSLRRLGRDRIDIYTLHEPQIDLLDSSEWNRWLQDCVAEGKVRYFGLALTADQLSPFLKQGKVLGQVIQLLDSLSGKEADILSSYSRSMQITFGYVSSASRDQNPPKVVEILQAALRRNATGAVIVSTKRQERLSQYALISESSNHAS